MAQPILVPQVGQDLTEAKVVELHVEPGDRVKKGDLVAVVESEKASFEVEAFAEGVVIEVRYAVGDVAEVLSPLMMVGEPQGADAKVSVPATAEGAKVESAVSAAPAPLVSVAAAAAPVATGSAVEKLRSSPLARRVAAQRGIDLGALVGTGPAGAVVLRDVKAAVVHAPEIAAGVLGDAVGPLEIRTLQAGQGAPLVFLHGFGADLSAWRPLVGQVGLGSPMLALDLPGHGASAGHRAARFEDLVDTVGRSLRPAGLGGLHLVGHSLGAAVAMALTERGDLDIRSLTLMAPAGLGASIDGSFVDGFLSARSEPALAAWMRRLVYDPARLSPTLVRATLAAREAHGLIEAQGRIARAVFEGSTQMFSTRDALHRFGGPVTVIAGREDAIISLREIEAALPGHAALHRLERVGHLPQVEAADLVQRLIVRTVRAAG